MMASLLIEFSFSIRSAVCGLQPVVCSLQSANVIHQLLITGKTVERLKMAFCFWCVKNQVFENYLCFTVVVDLVDQLF